MCVYVCVFVCACLSRETQRQISLYIYTTHMQIRTYIYMHINVSKVKLATIVEGDPKAPFSIATTPRCRGGRYSIPRIAPLYP